MWDPEGLGRVAARAGYDSVDSARYSASGNYSLKRLVRSPTVGNGSYIHARNVPGGGRIRGTTV